MSRFNLVSILVLVLCAIVHADVFQHIDTNANGALDRNEFRSDVSPPTAA